MRLPLFIALRYLFSKKSTNAINLITGISVLGITIGMAALILELAVFNGFEQLLSGLFNQFNPQMKITLNEGKFFNVHEDLVTSLQAMDDVEAFSFTLEEIALFEYDGSTVFANIKGVDSSFSKVTDLESAIISGDFVTQPEEGIGAIVGATLRNRLGISLQNPFRQLKVFVPRKKKRTVLDRPFKTSFLQPTGVFSFQQDYDNQYIFSDIDFVRNVLSLQDQASALELKLTDGADEEKLTGQLASVLGDQFDIKNRYEQDAAFFKLMNLEKWMFFALFSLTLLLIAFNMVGALWMLVIEKSKDISVLKSMGARDGLIFQIFITEGLLISTIGVVLGSVLAIGLYYYHIQYGLISIPEGFIVDRYPMELRWTDFIIAGITMGLIGFMASYMPARSARKKTSFIRSE